MNSKDGKSLDRLRAEIRAIDEEVLRLAKKRTDLARDIGRLKTAEGLPIQDFTVERKVLDHAREECAKLGLPPELGEDVMRPLVRGAIRVQESDRIAAAQVKGSKALIVGGAGLMGRWFARFLQSQGYRIVIADKAGAVPGFAYAADAAQGAADPEVSLIIVSVPPSACAPVLKALEASKTKALLFDIASLKAPLATQARAMAKKGFKIASAHPMFGPATDLLTGKHLVLCDVGSRAAVEEAKSLFRDTSVTIVETDLDTHDRMMSFVLGLAHANAILFNRVLVESGLRVAELTKTSSTSFDRQMSVSRLLAYENVDLYYEIQTLNEHAAKVLGLLATSAEEFRKLVAAKDKKAFERWMADSRKLFEGLALVEAKKSPVAGS